MTQGINTVYLLGIGGIGMSALARYFRHCGLSVSGYDKTETSLTEQLKKEGIPVHYTDDIALMPKQLVEGEKAPNILIIYTPAIPKNHKQFNYLKNNNYNLYKRSEVLGHITKSVKSIAVAGTHGKTTTSTLVAHLFKESNGHVNAFLGGISSNYETNLLLGEKDDFCVVEADEYDRSFLKLFPDFALITSMDPDHLDIYGSAHEMKNCYNEFAAQVKPNGKLIVKHGLEINQKRKYTYGFDNNADFFASNIHIENGNYVFDLTTPAGKVNNLKSGLPGRHNVENAIGAFAIAQLAGLSTEKISKAMLSFKGVKRRFEFIIKNEKLVFIDDYAHHPEELRACISSVKEMYPNKKIVGVFQPHLFSRTRDFANEFAEVLDTLDITILLEIYPAREMPIEGINSNMLIALMKNSNKEICSKENLIVQIKKYNPDVLITLGAGDIDKLIQPLKTALLN